MASMSCLRESEANRPWIRLCAPKVGGLGGNGETARMLSRWLMDRVPASAPIARRRAVRPTIGPRDYLAVPCLDTHVFAPHGPAPRTGAAL
jgi:hypothetical protein